VASHGAIWHGRQNWDVVAILGRGCSPSKTRRGLPADPDSAQSRYLEVAVSGALVGCLHLPNGNPCPGPKFAYRLAWILVFGVLAELLPLDKPVVLAGDYNVIAIDAEGYKPERWTEDALLAPGQCISSCLAAAR
jgi:exodeoxyribonuclease-3